MLVHMVKTLQRQPHLPPCGSYQDCSIGRNAAYNFINHVPNLTTCYLYCHGDPLCNYYSYHFRPGSEFHKHCFLMTARECSPDVEGPSGWVSAPKVCKNIITPLLNVLMASNNGLLRSTK